MGVWGGREGRQRGPGGVVVGCDTSLVRRTANRPSRRAEQTSKGRAQMGGWEGRADHRPGWPDGKNPGWSDEKNKAGWATHFFALAFFEPFAHSASSAAAFFESSPAFLLAAASAFLACPAAFLLFSPAPPPFLAIFVRVGWSFADPVIGWLGVEQPRPDDWDLQLSSEKDLCAFCSATGWRRQYCSASVGCSA